MRSSLRISAFFLKETIWIVIKEKKNKGDFSRERNKISQKQAHFLLLGNKYL